MDPVICEALRRVKSRRWLEAYSAPADPNDASDNEGTETVVRAGRNPELVADVLARVLPRLKERR